MIRIAHSVSNMDRAGIETMLMNYYRRVDTERFQFDFIVNKKTPGHYDEEIRSMGGRIFQSPGLNPFYFPKYMEFVQDIVRNNPEIGILHAHNEAMGWYALHGAKQAGIRVRIAHAHNTSIIRDYKYPLKQFCKRFLYGDSTHIFACGNAAGEYYFGDRWKREGIVLPNAIETASFAFSEEVRRRIRRDHRLGDAFVIGHVGRFNVQKNHTRILDIFKAVLNKRPDAILVLIGIGELQEEMKRKAMELGIRDHIRFLGLRSDVCDWYQAMDVFLMPSLFEGLPVTGIEAQTSGLPCFFSDCVTDEIVLLPDSCNYPLKATNDQWADKLLSVGPLAPEVRKQGLSVIKGEGYDIDDAVRHLEETYLSFYEWSHL